MKTRPIPSLLAMTLVSALPLAVHATGVVRVKPLPVTPAMDPPVTDTRFGITTTDPDRWLENLQDPEVQAWAKAQADYTRRVLDSIPGRAAVLAEIQRSEALTASSVQAVQRLNDGRLLVTRKLAGEQMAKLFVRDGIDGAERLLLDPAAGSADGKPRAISWADGSPDGKRVAVGVSEAGSEDAVMHLLEIATGNPVEAPMERMRFGMNWLPDSTGYTYTQTNVLRADAPPTDRYQNMQSRVHRIGTPRSQDAVIFGNSSRDPLDIKPEQIPFVGVFAGSRWLIAQAYTVGTRINVYAAALEDLGRSTIRWRKVVDETRDNVRDFSVRGDTLYLLQSDAPTRRIVSLDLADPAAAAREFVAPGTGSIETVSVATDALYYTAQAPSGVGIELFRRHGTARNRSASASPVAIAWRSNPSVRSWTGRWSRPRAGPCFPKSPRSTAAAASPRPGCNRPRKAPTPRSWSRAWWKCAATTEPWCRCRSSPRVARHATGNCRCC